MPLRAKKPIVEPNRFRALIYGAPSAGKSHFVTNIPYVYCIDTEGLSKYEKFMKFLLANNGDIVKLNDMTEIISEVKELLSIKHEYKTLVIDSISVPYNNLSHTEADRLIKSSVKKIEGTEFGANTAKPKRLLAHLGTLLSRLDMNVIVTAREKPNFVGNQEVGKMPDVGTSLAYDLGTTFHLYVNAGQRNVTVQKSRYANIKDGESFIFDDGYTFLKSRFGEEVFLRNSIAEKLASKEQITELYRLIKVANIEEDKQQKYLTKFSARAYDEISETNMQKIIDHINSQLTGADNV